jgi:hypothetical protein
MKKLTLLLFILITYSGFSQEILKNNDIVDLHLLGFEADVIISKIKASPQNEFDTSISVLKVLRENGVPSSVLAAMIDASKVEIKTGIFYTFNGENKEMVLNQFDGKRTKGALTAIALMGTTNVSFMAYILEPKSKNIVSKSKSEIYFQFGKENNDSFRKNKAWFSGASSPEEFELAQLNQRKKKRELKVGAYGVGAAMGIGGKTIVSNFTFEDLGNNRYKITLSQDLEYGEYCFIFNSDLGTDIKDVWDFTLVP